MPGIVGMISDAPVDDCESSLRSMIAGMHRESFYRVGTFCCGELGIYTGWVAHEKSFLSEQAFFNEQRDIVIVLAGECFVDDDVKTDLRRKGHCFTSGDG